MSKTIIQYEYYQQRYIYEDLISFALTNKTQSRGSYAAKSPTLSAHYLRQVQVAQVQPAQHEIWEGFLQAVYLWSTGFLITTSESASSRFKVCWLPVEQGCCTALNDPNNDHQLGLFDVSCSTSKKVSFHSINIRHQCKQKIANSIRCPAASAGAALKAINDQSIFIREKI